MGRKSKAKRQREMAEAVHNHAAALVNETSNAIVRNGLSDVLLSTSVAPPFGGSQLSELDTLFKNNRWYLISNHRQLLSEIYVEHGLIRALVDTPVDDAMRGGVEISSQQLSTDDIQELEEVMEREDDYGVIAQAKKWTRLFGGGGILIITDQDPTTPLDIAKIKKGDDVEFRPVDMWELFHELNDTMDVSQQGYAPLLIPEYYNYYGQKVHKSRVLRMKGLTAPSLIRPRLRGWGFSIVEHLVRSINQYLKSTDLSFEVLDEFKVDVFKIKNLTMSLLNPEGEAAISKRINIANREKNYRNAITMDAEDDYVQKQVSFAGLAEAMDGIRKQIAADMRMPITKLFGVSSAGFNSGEDDIENYNSMVEGEIRSKIKFDILRVIEIRCLQLFGFVPDDLSIEFKPLRVLSSEQEENVKTSRLSRICTAYEKGLLSPKEAKEAINKEKLLPVQLDTTDELFQVPGNEGQSEKAPALPKSKLSAPEVKNSDEKIENLHKQDLMAFDGPKIVTVGVVSGDELLTGKRRDNGLWTNPGGHMDDVDLSPEDAAVREVFEETGIKISKSQLKRIYGKKLVSHRTGKEFVVFGFIASVNKQEATPKYDPDKEFAEIKWVKIDESTPELKTEARHAKEDCVTEYLFKNKGVPL